jgi:hypothetical protein
MSVKRLGQVSATIAALAAGSAIAVNSAGAHSPADPKAVGDIAKMTANANVVFHGKVARVVYRNAPVAGGGSVPFTYVTYDVTDTLLGASRKQVTLRFIGGSNGQGGFVSVEGVPAFSPGDEDIMFVKGNGEAGCPLVQCEFGRYRVLNGAVYEAHGSPVLGISDGRIATGGAGPAALEAVSYPAPTFDDLMKNPAAAAQIKRMGMTMEQARARYNAEAPKTIVARASHAGNTAKAPVKAGLPLAGMMASLKSAIGAAPRRALAPLPDADPTRVIPALKVQAAAPPK